MNYSISDVLHLTFRMEEGEILSQSHSGEYDWLGPDPPKNSQGQRYPYIPVGFYYSDPYHT